MRDGLPSTVATLTPWSGSAVVCSVSANRRSCMFKEPVRRVDPGLLRFVCGMEIL